MAKAYLKEDGRPDDRAWLYDNIFNYIIRRSDWEQHINLAATKTDIGVFEQFVRGSFERPSWPSKNSKAKREMISAVLRRLVSDGKIKVSAETVLDTKSTHGTIRSNLQHRAHMLGSECDGVARTYAGTNVLQAMADALGPVDG